MPGKIATEQMRRAHGGKEIVENNSDGAGDEECEHRGKCARFAALEVAGINDGNRNGQSNVGDDADGLEGGPNLKFLAEKKWKLHAKAGVENEEMQIEDQRMRLFSPGEEGGSEPVGGNEKE